ncbi:fumarylacetoacetate hydrolase family protein [Streptomyces sp. WAC01280]|uniref:fumarylacetoacetate hydrolase family protein n=1 Tax=Streptomyces sp. WAC01280 TaxID=2487424 RepID=UPI0037DD6E8C
MCRCLATASVRAIEPGDMILTGTPRGAGVFSGRHLRHGDVVEVEDEHIGTLRNRVRAASESADA